MESTTDKIVKVKSTKVKTSKPKSTSDKKPRKKTISKALKTKVWKNMFNTTNVGYCYTCNRPLDQDTFDCGHIIAEANGGQTIEEGTLGKWPCFARGHSFNSDLGR